jgi:hypothetical protein
MTDVMIETHLGAPVGAVDAIAAMPGNRNRQLVVGGRRAVIDDPGDSPAQAVFILIPWPDGSYTEIRTFSLLDRPADPPPGFGVSVGLEEVLAVAASLHSVDQATWDALPKR